MNKFGSIVKQATILAIAGILVRIIGVLYRSPLTMLIGDEGIGYYSTAYNIYALVLLISSYSIPTAISKLISEKLAVGEYKNANKILQCAFIYIIAIGGSAAIIAFILAPYIVSKNAVMALRILCPTIFLSGLLGVFRGYFQAQQTTLYTSVSQILEQILNALVSVGAAYLFIQPYTAGSSELASHGAAGSALGTGAGVLAGLIYMILVYIRKKGYEKEEIESDYTDSYSDIFKMILHIVTPIIIATCVYNLVSTIDMYIYYFMSNLHHLTDVESAINFGIYSGKYIVLTNVPVALASAMSTASIPAISTAYAKNDKKEPRSHIQKGITLIMILLIPMTVGMAVLAKPIMTLLFPQKSSIEIASRLLMFGSPAIVFYGLSTFTNGVLQAIGEVNIPLKNAVKALIIHVVLISALLFLTNLDIYILVIGNATYALTVCILNSIYLNKILGYKEKFKSTYILPLISSIIMGILVYISYIVIRNILGNYLIAMMISVVIGVIVYFAIIIYFYAGSNNVDLNKIPVLNKFIK